MHAALGIAPTMQRTDYIASWLEVLRGQSGDCPRSKPSY
ncbi:hypothetical protein [Bradyrhizobium sp. Ec3.3]